MRAAFLAGYDHKESLDIAYSAQFVDECTRTLLSKVKGPSSAATTQSQIELADMYIQGQGTKKDFKKAIKWLEKAAKQANVNASSASDAMYLIATCYFYGGNGIKKDLVKAKEWMQKSAALGNESAINSLPNLK